MLLYVPPLPPLMAYGSLFAFMAILALIGLAARAETGSVRQLAVTSALVLCLTPALHAAYVIHPCWTLNPNSWAWLLAMCWML